MSLLKPITILKTPAVMSSCATEDQKYHIPRGQLEGIIGISNYNMLMAVDTPEKIYKKQKESYYLKERQPLLFAQIHPILNKDIELGILTFGNKNDIFWICSHPKCNCKTHHVWRAPCCDRARGQGCPYCANSNSKTCMCESFATLYPDLLREFDWVKNVGINPYKLRRKSTEEVYWICSSPKCSYGLHKWSATIDNRVSGKTNCP